MAKSDSLEYRRRYRNYHYGMGYRAQVPAFGAQRRIQALQAIGYTIPRLSEETGLSQIYLRQLSHGIRANRIDRRRDAKIREVYSTLCVQPLHKGYGPKRARNAAKANGWYPPMAWDDIDDPKQRPSLHPKRRYPSEQSEVQQ